MFWHAPLFSCSAAVHCGRARCGHSVGTTNCNQALCSTDIFYLNRLHRSVLAPWVLQVAKQNAYIPRVHLPSQFVCPSLCSALSNVAKFALWVATTWPLMVFSVNCWCHELRQTCPDLIRNKWPKLMGFPCSQSIHHLIFAGPCAKNKVWALKL